MYRFHKGYFGLTAGLFLIEVLIAMYVQDDFIRPYFGDFLVVILMYCFLRSFANLDVKLTVIAVLLFSYLIEELQYLNFVELIGMGNSELARTVIGTSFAWMDLVAYTAGCVAILLFERMKPAIWNLKSKSA
ncbi:MAG: hypothetical protein B7X86_04955 [Sphingobacteriales bacterium 17-39-43]|uniref:ribosomal maturation YjgA family protein n=1 Tax=Daejeonella sp. TaxID=2805397 RepID=UPI000BDB3550|nr:DUF2809 domain-containing protein [Daejeonella sp.]OYY02236.1 MAG: hypothetical protein B7Y76_05940 [Sphingobacteriia bacterium 35-40-5]OYZ32190.1 MAG: hypothetical protein B7Y24_05775 [Sphingobacteriales bacterium 16-39-50]OYZ52878.1 MAG: hypothetical protein B7Y19_05630 [Sphingobacteriales bacterium 24-40-4]OZA25534.1 MAG: hypothetical protein B7X86_04955 [Sphingobacteriales bacterium 17-39-43]OZA59295.1 MAG: hypothetical protein B7X75_04200 [Sphingobacteriales bacterium 39-40-5]